jgi:hypothetical protein
MRSCHGLLFTASSIDEVNSKRGRANAVRKGYERGTPDLFIAHACGGYHGLWVEMKRRFDDTTAVSDVQWKYMSRLRANGYQTFVCFGADDAITRITSYLLQCDYDEAANAKPPE